tara:strand:+ start:492 stop:1592 length:1101 start_codon:yes stop_codon:yes gene_type:complete
MQFIDLQAQYKRLKPEIDGAIQKVLDHGKYILGPEVSELEEKLADYVGVKHCIGTSSGTDSLVTILMTLGIGPGDLVIVPDFTFIATAEAVTLTGADPIFCDVDISMNMDPVHLEQLLIEHQEAKFVIAVDIFGTVPNYRDILEVCHKHNVLVIEDAAQSMGADFFGKKAGSYGIAAATSFFPAKPLGCYGDGGAIFTDDDSIAELARSIIVHGKGENKYDNVRLGYNARLDTIQAAILLEKLKVLDDEIFLRNEVAEMYFKYLDPTILSYAYLPEGMRPAWAQFSVCAKTGLQRQILMNQLTLNKIPTGIYYDKPLHEQVVFKQLFGDKYASSPFTENLCGRIFSLPMHPYLTEKEIKSIAQCIY